MSPRPVRMVLVVVLWLLPAALFVGTLRMGWERTWKAVGVPTMAPAFLDLRVITSGVLTREHGGDPLVSNPFDPLHRALNYPRIWLALFSALKIKDGNVVLVGLALCALFLAVVSWMIFRAATNWEAVVLLLGALSVSSLYGMERGNIDLLIFALVYCGCVARTRSWGPALFAVAALLKIYPIAGLAMDAMEPRKRKVIPLISALAVVLILAWQWRDLMLIGRYTPVASVLSFGVLSIRETLLGFALRFGLPSAQAKHFGYLVVTGCWGIAAAAVAVSWTRCRDLDRFLREAGVRSYQFGVFGAIYGFAFSIGSNWDYRLIFLLPTIPLAIFLAGQRRYRYWCVLYVLLALFSLNSPPVHMRFGLVLIHTASFAVYVMALMVLARLIRMRGWFDAVSGNREWATKIS